MMYYYPTIHALCACGTVRALLAAGDAVWYGAYLGAWHGLVLLMLRDAAFMQDTVTERAGRYYTTA